MPFLAHNIIFAWHWVSHAVRNEHAENKRVKKYKGVHLKKYEKCKEKYDCAFVKGQIVIGILSNSSCPSFVPSVAVLKIFGKAAKC